ncbi:MAG: discoidin domain-containing protein, partial [Acidobacteriota bacterium]
PEPDLAGYLLYRDGRLVNASGPVIDDLTPFLLDVTQFSDPDLADGTYAYVVQAVDTAGNLSDPSNPGSVTVETQAPRAVIVDPTHGQRFESALDILAETVDNDVAQVVFQYRLDGTSAWTDLGPAVTLDPWTTGLDPVALGLDFGPLDLRAVATDEAGQTDPAPPSITVEYADLTPPETIVSLTTRVDGGDVTLTWEANSEVDLVGYHVYRSTTLSNPRHRLAVRLTDSPITETTYLDPDRNDRTYYYWVNAIDEQGNESDFAAETRADVFTPTFDQPFIPVSAVTLVGGGRPGYEALLELTRDGATIALPPVMLELDTTFSLDLDLDPGVIDVDLLMEDAVGNRSKRASILLVVGEAPSRPQGLAGTVDGFDVDLTWEANPEPDLAGYQVFRNGEPLLQGDVAEFDRFDARTGVASRAFDFNPATFWRPNSRSSEWLEVGWQSPRLLTGVEIDWYQASSAWAARDYRIQGLLEGIWVTLATRTGNRSASNIIVFDQPYRTDALRLQIDLVTFSPRTERPRVLEMRVQEIPLVAPASTPAYTDTAPDGTHLYTVTAFSELGFESLPSDPTSPIDVGDVFPPDPPILSAVVVDDSDVELSWTEVDDAVRYDLYRDGVKFHEHVDLANRLHLDPRRPNGTYVYTARAVDAVGNVSQPSNEATVTLAVEPPPIPIDLVVTAPIAGGKLDVAWQPGAGLQPLGYVLLRSTTSGGPYTEIVTTAATQFLDEPLDNGVRYYYVVIAFDELLNRSGESLEASGVPQNTIPPLAPALHYPTIPGRVALTDEAAVAIAGRAEPASR